jgi:hypothetical protein
MARLALLCPKVRPALDWHQIPHISNRYFWDRFCEIPTDRFRQFCEVGDIDVASGVSWDCDAQWEVRRGFSKWSTRWIWLSRTADVVVEASESPFHEPYIPHCRFIGIVGRADKVIEMYNFLIKESGTQGHDADWKEMVPGTSSFYKKSHEIPCTIESSSEAWIIKPKSAWALSFGDASEWWKAIKCKLHYYLNYVGFPHLQ